MKKSALILATLAVGFAAAAPTYYTFTGTVNFVPTDVGGYAAAHGIKAGTAVSYVFAVETASNGYTHFDGTKSEKQDIVTDGYRADYFFDSLITPSVFSAAVTDTASGSFFGYYTITTSGGDTRYSAAFQTTIGPPEKGTQIVLFLPNANWVAFLPKVGDAVTATESYTNGSAGTSGVSMTLTLAAISATKPSLALRSRMAQSASWAQAGIQGGQLILRNASGKTAYGKVMDASGKTLLEIPFGEQAAFPASILPRGKLFLEATSPVKGESVWIALFH